MLRDVNTCVANCQLVPRKPAWPRGSLRRPCSSHRKLRLIRFSQDVGGKQPSRAFLLREGQWNSQSPKIHKQRTLLRSLPPIGSTAVSRSIVGLASPERRQWEQVDVDTCQG